MNRKIRLWLRKWIPKVISVFEPEGRKGKWFEERYYTYLFTRSKHYSSRQPNSEESERWLHIKELVLEAMRLGGNTSFIKIIDLGCGRGWLAHELSKYGPVIGIEPVAKVVAYGKKIYPGLDLRQGDLSLIQENEADLIVCSEVIEHVGKAKLPNFFRSLYGSLTTPGFLVITTPRAEANKTWASYVDLDQPTEEWLSEEEVRNVAINAGFTTVRKIVYGRSPVEGAPKVDIYQQWLFRR